MERRKILITHGMSNDKVIILTDATRERIEECCRLELTQEHGIFHALECLKVTNCVKELFDSEVDDMEEIDSIGYEEVYDLSDYAEIKSYHFTEKGIETWYEDILNDCLEEKEETELEIKVSVNGKEVSIPTTADNIEIIYGAIKECRENTIDFGERRKVMISSVTGKRKVVLITDATEERIEEVISNEEVKTHGFTYIKGELEKYNYTKELIDTNFDDEYDVDVIGYDEYYTCK